MDVDISSVEMGDGEARVELTFVVGGRTQVGRGNILGTDVDPCRATLRWIKEEPGWRLVETEELDIPSSGKSSRGDQGSCLKNAITRSCLVFVWRQPGFCRSPLGQKDEPKRLRPDRPSSPSPGNRVAGAHHIVVGDVVVGHHPDEVVAEGVDQNALVLGEGGGELGGGELGASRRIRNR